MGEAGEPATTGTGQAATGDRPTGVTILAALAFIEGIFLLLGGALAIVGGGMLPGAGIIPAAVLSVAGGVAVLFGVIAFLAGWGLLNGKNWAWLLAIVLAVFGLFIFPIGTIISIAILYYLTRPKVKRFFGRGEAQAA